MRVMSFVVLPAAALLATAAGAETKAPAEPAQGSSAKVEAADKKICKRLETSGTRMTERACLTKDEWKKVEAQK